MGSDAIITENLTRIYQRPRKRQWLRRLTGRTVEPPKPDFVALDGVNLEVKTGELFGLLGPNGAGKTTLIKILTTLLAPTTGTARVAGLDVVADALKVRPLINVVSGGESCGYGVLNVQENLWLFSQIYGVTNAEAKVRIAKMLDVVGLADKATTRISHLSTGQRQKMNFCRGFITDPQILFLDEPTLGLDVNAARSIRKFVREWLAERTGRTLLLTTHYMMEADELCDRLAIIDKGKILICDTPTNLKRRAGGRPRFDIRLLPGPNGPPNFDHINGVHRADIVALPTELEARVTLDDDSAIGVVVQRIVESGAKMLNLNKSEPTLEDVFIDLVGHGLNDEVKSQ